MTSDSIFNKLAKKAYKATIDICVEVEIHSIKSLIKFAIS